ncbi:hypothetical protein [Modicisalibacter coralii]|uniref:hypothetical protein n=1 Tax=Modicisalibacter coralii TaxID=2304602 RepID=UPI001396CD4A|nr:hypothetical protein [Halomonas coralii]
MNIELCLQEEADALDEEVSNGSDQDEVEFTFTHIAPSGRVYRCHASIEATDG